jgi:hypothetical protein
MSTVAADTPTIDTRRVPIWGTRQFILFAGVIVIPLALSLVFNSWGALTVESAITMAFASVAGQTIAILAAVAIVVSSVVRKQGTSSLVLSLIVALVVISLAISSMASAGDLLQQRLALIAEVDLLNR